MDSRELKAKYVFHDDYEPEYVTGTIGSILPTGELVMNFYMERFPVPYETKQTIKDTGELESQLVTIKPEPEEMKLRRTIKSGVILSQPTALSIYQWMKTKLKEMGVDESEL